MKKIAFFLMFLILTGCERNVLYPSDSGRTLDLKIGEKFSIKLPENPSTGYGWRILIVPQGQMIVSQVADQFARSQSNVLGADGERVFQYQATNSGEVEIYGVESRPWESSSAVQPSVKYRIVVR